MQALKARVTLGQRKGEKLQNGRDMMIMRNEDDPEKERKKHYPLVLLIKGWYVKNMRVSQLCRKGRKQKWLRGEGLKGSQHGLCEYSRHLLFPHNSLWVDPWKSGKLGVVSCPLSLIPANLPSLRYGLRPNSYCTKAIISAGTQSSKCPILMQKENKTRLENRQVRFLPAVRLFSPATDPALVGRCWGQKGVGRQWAEKAFAQYREESGKEMECSLTWLPWGFLAPAGTSLLSFVYTALISALLLLPNPWLPGRLVQTSHLRYLSHLRAHVPLIR